MFDPHHNAVDNYYLVNGSLKGSWDGLSRDVIIANWNSGKASESLKFFAGRGHRQVIAGYYDADDLSNFRAWDAAARGVSGVFGFMYTTWQSKYNLLEKYGHAMRGPGRRALGHGPQRQRAKVADSPAFSTADRRADLARRLAECASRNPWHLSTQGNPN